MQRRRITNEEVHLGDHLTIFDLMPNLRGQKIEDWLDSEL